MKNTARNLVGGTSQAATLTTGAKDLAGNPLAKSRVWSFTVRRWWRFAEVQIPKGGKASGYKVPTTAPET